MKRSFPFVSFLILSSFLLLSACSHPEGYRSPKSVTIPERIMSQPTSILLEKPIFTIDTGGHKAAIKYVTFTRDGKYLVSASHDKTARVWDVETGEVVRVLRGQIGEGMEGSILAAALSPDDRFLAVGVEFRDHKSKTSFIRLLDFQTGEVTALLKGHRGAIIDLAFSTDGKKLVSGSMDGTARIWNVSSGKTLHVLKEHEKRIRAVAFSPDGTRVVTGSQDRTLKLWNAQRGSLITILKGHQKKVQCAAFTPDGRYLLSGSDDKTIRLWDGSTGVFIKVLSRHDEPVRSLSVSPDGTKVLTGHVFESKKKPENFRSNNVLSIPSGEHVTSFTKHWPRVLTTAISPDGSTAATVEASIYLFKRASGAGISH
jgi:WD40 repeat protein